MERRDFLIGSLALALLAACDSGSGSASSGGDGDGDQSDGDEARSDAVRQPGSGSTELAVRAVNGVGTTLYRTLAAAAPVANLVLSPASIGIALGMTREGARGITAEEMDRVLGVVDPTMLAPSMNTLDQALAARSGSRPDASGTAAIDVVLRIASSLWGQQGLAWKQPFLDVLAESYGAGIELTDFAADPAAARDEINTWVSDQTEGRITKLLPEQAIDELTRLVLVNAIYLKAPWLNPFDQKSTAQAQFNRPDGTTVPVSMMRSSGELAYAAADGWQSVDLPYGGYELTMTLFVPDLGRLAEVEPHVNADTLNNIVAAQALRPVDLGLPKWDTASAFSLADALGAAGMPSAFDPSVADFSGMTDAERLYLSAVEHQANISVDEAGTEAAAATAVVAVGSGAPAAPPVSLVVDRPFIFFIRDVATGAVVFMGRVADPSAPA
jgi:serpin B